MDVRFWKKVNKLGPIPEHCAELGRCWVWMGATNQGGYGVLRTKGKNILAPRISWMLHVGPIPDGVKILHHCDNPPCVRATHLFNGSIGDNVDDMMKKGRDMAQKVTFRGETLRYSEWAERLGITSRALRRRLERGWSKEDALTTPFISNQEAGERAAAARWKA